MCICDESCCCGTPEEAAYREFRSGKYVEGERGGWTRRRDSGGEYWWCVSEVGEDSAGLAVDDGVEFDGAGGVGGCGGRNLVMMRQSQLIELTAYGVPAG